MSFERLPILPADHFPPVRVGAGMMVLGGVWAAIFTAIGLACLLY